MANSKTGTVKYRGSERPNVFKFDMNQRMPNEKTYKNQHDMFNEIKQGLLSKSVSPTLKSKAASKKGPSIKKTINSKSSRPKVP